MESLFGELTYTMTIYVVLLLPLLIAQYLPVFLWDVVQNAHNIETQEVFAYDEAGVTTKTIGSVQLVLEYRCQKTRSTSNPLLISAFPWN